MKTKPALLIASPLLAVLAACGTSTGGGSQPTTQPTVQPTTKATGGLGSSPAAKTSPAKVTVREGMYAVPDEVKPGTYTTTASGSGCYWARLSSDADTTAIIDNANLDDGAHGRLVVKKTDKGLELDGPCVWTKVK